MKNIFSAVILFFATGQVITAQQFVSVHPAETAINQDYREKRITLDDAILFKFYHLYDKSKLPAKYHTEQQTIAKCGTMIFVDYENHKNKLQKATIQAIESFLIDRENPTESMVYISPSGRFELTYDTIGTNAVPKADVNPANGIPDFIEKCALYCDYSWFVEIDSIGFTPPPINPPTTRYKISFEAMDYYGYTTPYGGSYGTRIVLHNTYLGFPANDDPDGDQLGAMKVTICHEFKHASQYKTSRWTEGDWVEVDATWSEDIVYDATNDYYNYLGDTGSPFMSPGSSLDGNGSGGSYEDCTWQHYMSQTHGNSIIRDYWARRAIKLSSESVLNSYDSTLAAYGSGLSQAFRAFTAWNYLSGERAVPGFGYDEAPAYPTSQLCRSHTAFPASGSQCQLDHLAANFIHLPSDASDSVLSFTFNGQNTVGMSLQVVIRYADATVDIMPVPLDGNNDISNFPLPVRLKQILFMGLVPVITQKTGTGFTYSYSISKLPGLSLRHTPLTAVQDSSGPYPVEAIIRSVGEGLDFSKMKLFYGSGSITDSVALALTDGDSVFSAVIPYPGNYVSVRYYLSADDSGGYRVTSPTGAPGQYHEFSVGEDVIAPVLTVLPVNSIPVCREFPLPVQAIVTDQTGVDSVMAKVEKNSVLWETFPLVQAFGDTFSGFIAIDTSSLNLGDTLSITVIAKDVSPFRNTAYGIPLTAKITKEYIIEKLISKSIPDNNVNGIYDTLYLSTGQSFPNHPIEDVDVLFGATHPFIGDLSVSLTAPAGFTKAVMHRPGLGTIGSGGDNPDIALDDESAKSIEDITFSGTQLVTGTFRPYPDTLSSYDGSPVSGMWVMKVSDNRTNNTGTWTKWGLRLRTVSASVTSLAIRDEHDVPAGFELFQNYPNPFNPVTSISYTLPEFVKIRLSIYNTLGQKVTDLVHQSQKAGRYTVLWNGKNNQGNTVSSGVYLYRLTAGNKVLQNKMLLLK